MRLRNRISVIKQLCLISFSYSLYLELARDRCPRGGLGGLVEAGLAGNWRWPAPLAC
jgi:hypothetical protein